MACDQKRQKFGLKGSPSVRNVGKEMCSMAGSMLTGVNLIYLCVLQDYDRTSSVNRI